MVNVAELRGLLGGPQTLPEGFKKEPCGVVALTRIELEPGDVLYMEGSKVTYAYVVESGLIQGVRRQHIGDRAPDAVSFAAAHNVLGLDGMAQRRSETASAVTRTTLLAVSVEGLSAMAQHSALLSELIARPMGQALMRDWRTVYRLRDLPPYARTVAGLSHLINLLTLKGDEAESLAVLSTSIDVTALCRWLGEGAEELQKCLAQLQRYGALSLRNGRIDTLVPGVLLHIFSALRPWRKDERLEPPPQPNRAGGLLHGA